MKVLILAVCRPKFVILWETVGDPTHFTVVYSIFRYIAVTFAVKSGSRQTERKQTVWAHDVFGMEYSKFYDSLLARFITFGKVWLRSVR